MGLNHFTVPIATSISPSTKPRCSGRSTPSGEQIREIVERHPHLREGAAVGFDARLSIHQIKRALCAHERSQYRIDSLSRHPFSRFDHFNPTSHETKGISSRRDRYGHGRFPVDIYVKGVDASNAASETHNLQKTKLWRIGHSSATTVRRHCPLAPAPGIAVRGGQARDWASRQTGTVRSYPQARRPKPKPRSATLD